MLGSTDWPRLRDIACAIGLLAICCRPGPSGYVGVFRIVDGAADADQYATRTSLYEMLAAADIDNDGDDEILASSNVGIVTIGADHRPRSLWQGHYLLRVQQISRAEPPRFELVAIVEDEDGRPTLALVACRSDESSCEATFERTLAPGSLDFAAADFDDDGIVDVVVGGAYTLVFHRGVRTGAGALEWSEGVPLEGDGAWWVPSGGMAAGDIDADGRSDVVVVSGADDVSILLGDGEGSFGEVTTISQPGAAELETLRVAELTGDSHPEIVAASPYGGGFVFENPGHPTESRSFELPALQSSDPPLVFVGRFDEQPGREILLVDALLDNARLVIYDGAASRWREEGLGPVEGDRVYAMSVVADIDGDGRDELSTAIGLPIYCE